MDEPVKLRTWLCSVVFADVVGYSARAVEVQMTWKRRFNAYLAHAIEDLLEADRVILDTGDGAAICFLGDPEAAMFATLRLLNSLVREEPRQADAMRVRIGINLGSVKLVKDINGNTNAVGDGINVAQRVMSFASENQILVSRSFYEVVSTLSESYHSLFVFHGVHKDKHVREHTVYDLRPPGAQPHPSAVQSVTPAGPPTLAAPGPAAAAAVDASIVARAEAALAPVLGPIARHLVKTHAAKASTPADLVRALLEFVPGKDDQARFIRAFAGGAGTAPAAQPIVVAGDAPDESATPDASAMPDASATPAPALPVAWDPALLDRARTDLAAYMGPMAKVIVNRAAAKAQTLKQLYDLLAAEIPSAADQAKFRKGARAG